MILNSKIPSIKRLAICGAAAGLMLCMRQSSGQTTPEITVTINGQPVQFQDIGPQQISGRTMVPVRGVLEKLGANVSYNGATRTVVATTPTMDVQLVIGSRTAIVNTAQVTLDVPAQTIQDHTFVPLRFLGEALGAKIQWNADTRTVVITTKDAAPTAQVPQDRQRDDHDRLRERDRADADRGPAPTINSFTHNAPHGWLRSGQSLEVTLIGTPRAQASFRIPGLAEDVAMAEVEPGRYVGVWQIPQDRPIQLRSAAVIGSLKAGTKASPLMQAGETISVDAFPPVATEMQPESGAFVSDPRPGISASFDDIGSGIDKDSISLKLNGVDVTSRASVTRKFILYKPDAPLPGGRQDVDLRLSDVAGNRIEKHWVFNEQARAVGGIMSVKDNFDHPFQPGDVLRVEMMASAGGRAEFSVGTIKDLPLREDRPGHYFAEYTIRRGDDVMDQPAAFRLVTPDGQRFHQGSTRNIRIATGKPEPPTILQPGLNAPAVNPLVIRGKSAPNCRIEIRVDYRNRVLGLVALTGTAANTVVSSGRDGRWESAPINIGGILGNRGVEFTITAVAISASDEKSEPVVTRFKIN